MGLISEELMAKVQALISEELMTEVQAVLEKHGYQYGEDAREQVCLGWRLKEIEEIEEWDVAQEEVSQGEHLMFSSTITMIVRVRNCQMAAFPGSRIEFILTREDVPELKRMLVEFCEFIKE